MPASEPVRTRIEPASTGRAKCRGCGRKIDKGELRFGEVLPNPFGEGDATYYFHLACAACMRPEGFLPALERAALPDGAMAAALRSLAELGIQHRRLTRLARAERAASGRARCRLCHDLIEKNTLRFALQLFEDGRMAPIGTIHVQCAEAYFGTAELLERLERLGAVLPEDRPELVTLLANQRPAPEGGSAPGLAKAGVEAEAESESLKRDAGGNTR
ncbi:MAG TPA: hypothetical protein VKY73_07015 [Polyangiaceae bacterium]|nr:hypothetical protein [Polyangiaceae bacterium]